MIALCVESTVHTAIRSTSTASSIRSRSVKTGAFVPIRRSPPRATG
jgi:hypothetical protein